MGFVDGFLFRHSPASWLVGIMTVGSKLHDLPLCNLSQIVHLGGLPVGFTEGCLLGGLPACCLEDCLLK